ncbi:long-chain-fatty-acid--CoA ligase [Desulfofundulus sp.]|uniref:long-chain-fatty-acid--CoA ligase n=1 Tax=Desulfofundulus sp. TaxID=2282750 RepID=UPI003C7897B1
MAEPYEAFWPARLPRYLTYPEVPLYRLLEVAAEFYPDKTAINYYGNLISYQHLQDQVNRLAGALAARGLQVGDRVALYMQNSPHYVVAFYGVLRAGGVVVPVNPMLSRHELLFLLQDSEASGIITTSDLYPRVAEVAEQASLKFIITGLYHDYLPEEPLLPLPDTVKGAPQPERNSLTWQEILQENLPPPAVQVKAEQFCFLPYTSGSTGIPKGCMHTHKTVMANLISSYYWLTNTVSSVHLTTLPLFHVTGLVHSMLAPLYAGATLVLLTRWDKQAALEAIERFRCTHWVNITTMLIDFLTIPDLNKHDLSSLVAVGGGGASLPEAVGKHLEELTGLKYIEGYGMTETISQTHFNPPDRPKLQCIGIPDFNVDARIVDVESGAELPQGMTGELVVNGPEVFLGYWKRPQETEASFIELDGKKFFRTGDIARMDEEGYFYIVDRTKRMINAAGYKVWPAEVESYLYQHPAILEACVVGVADPVRVEEVRAYVVLREEFKDKLEEKELIAWCKERMAPYKYPRQVVFVDSLPHTATGKVNWRLVQETAHKEKEA